MYFQAGQTICPSQIFWGAQTYSDTDRFAPVIAAVDNLGIRDNTYIVFSSDNGAQGNKWTNTQPGAFDNAVGTQGPFRGCKASLYDGGHRVPFIVSGPGVPRGRVDHSLLSSVDWLPTVSSVAEACVPEAGVHTVYGLMSRVRCVQVMSIVDVALPQPQAKALYVTCLCT